MQQQTRASLFALAAVLCWSTVATAFKLSLRHLDPFQLLAWSALSSTLVLGGLLAMQGRLGAALRLTRAQPLRSLTLGVMNPCLYYLMLFRAYELLPAQVAQPINYTWAVTLMLLSGPLLGQRIRALQWGAVLVSYCGVVVIATRGELTALRFESPLGVVLALAGTVVWALYWIAGTRDTRDPIQGLFGNFLCSLPVVFGLCAVYSTPWPVDVRGLAGAAYVGCFEMGLSFVCWLMAMRLSENTARVGNLIFLAPFLSLVFIRFVLGEVILPSTFAGFGLIMGGLVLQRCGGMQRR